MHVDRQRRRTDDKRAHAGINAVQHSAEQIREALAELPPCDGVTSVKLRRGVRRDLPGSERSCAGS